LLSYSIPEEEVVLSAIRAQGAGGQNVNKVSSAIHLRFDVAVSSLPPELKERLLALSDSRLSKDGVLVIKAQTHRTQEANRAAAMARLNEWVNSEANPPKARRETRATYGSVQRRLAGKSIASQMKRSRARVSTKELT
jgi:ribosome-associated protein